MFHKIKEIFNLDWDLFWIRDKEEPVTDTGTYSALCINGHHGEHNLSGIVTTKDVQLINVPLDQCLIIYIICINFKIAIDTVDKNKIYKQFNIVYWSQRNHIKSN